MGQQGPPSAKKIAFFSKMIRDHMKCQNNYFWRVFSSWWPVLALLKSQNALKMGCLGTKNGSKMGQKCVFPKIKRPPKSHIICAQWTSRAPNQKATWLKTRFPVYLIHPQPPIFGGFYPSELPQLTLRTMYPCRLSCGKLQEVAQGGGCQNGSTRST